MTKFEHQLAAKGREIRLELIGVLDEDCELLPLADDLEGETITIDLGAIERMNQAGAKLWHEFVDLLEASGFAVVLGRCSPAIVTHLNRSGVGNATVESFAMPYFCPECDEARTLWAKASDLSDGGDSIEPPVKRCPQCDLVMQFDDDAKSYFGFLSGESRPRRKAPSSQPQPNAEAAAGTPFLLMVLAVAIVIAGAALALFLAN